MQINLAFKSWAELMSFVESLYKHQQATTIMPSEEVIKGHVANLGLKTMTRNILRSEHIDTVKELLERSESDLLCIPNCGRGTLADITFKLARFGLKLREPQ